MISCPLSDQRHAWRQRLLTALVGAFLSSCTLGPLLAAPTSQPALAFSTRPVPLEQPLIHPNTLLFVTAGSTVLLVLGSLLLWRQKRVALRQTLELRSLTDNLRRSQEALRQSEERFRRAFEEGPVGIVLASPRSLVLRANRALCDMLGYSEEELLGLGL